MFHTTPFHHVFENVPRGLIPLQMALKLDVLDKNLLKEWIISADERDMAPQIKNVRRMAAVLAQKDVGVCWVNRFVKRHEDIQSRYTKRYDYQHALCQDPKRIQEWFQLVKNMVAKYGLHPDDVYNFA